MRRLKLERYSERARERLAREHEEEQRRYMHEQQAKFEAARAQEREWERLRREDDMRRGYRHYTGPGDDARIPLPMFQCQMHERAHVVRPTLMSLHERIADSVATTELHYTATVWLAIPPGATLTAIWARDSAMPEQDWNKIFETDGGDYSRYVERVEATRDVEGRLLIGLHELRLEHWHNRIPLFYGQVTA